MDGNNRRSLPDGRKEMQRPGEMEDVKKIHARARKMLYHVIGNFVWARGSAREEVGGSHKKFSGRERRANGQVRRLRGSGMTKLREIASGSATGSLAEKQKSDISGKQRRPKLTSWEKNS